MAQIIELFALVQRESRDVGAPITQIIRTYEGRGRAEQDLELLNDTNPDAIYDILTIPHID